MQPSFGCHRAAGDLLHAHRTLGKGLGVKLGPLRLFGELGLFIDRRIEYRNRVANTVLVQAAGGTEPTRERTERKGVDDKDEDDRGE